MYEIMLGIGGGARVLYPDSGPGPKSAVGDSNVAYFGEVQNSELFTAVELKAQIQDLAASQVANDTDTWLKFLYYGRYLFIKKRPILREISSGGIGSWNGLYSAGLIYGVDGPGPYNIGYEVLQLRVVTKGEYKFKVMTITGDETSATTLPAGNLTDVTVRRKSMWTELLYRMSTVDYAPYTEKKFARLNSSQLTSSWECTAELLVNTTYPTGGQVSRGPGASNSIAQYNAPVNRNTGGYYWRPVLELIKPDQIFIVRINNRRVIGGLNPIPVPDVVPDQDAKLLLNLKNITNSPWPLTVTSVTMS